MATAFRTVAAVIVGVFVAFILLVAVELLSAVVHPVPPNFGGTTEEMCDYVASYPPWVLALAVPAWGLTGFVSTWIARRIGNRGTAFFVGILFMAAVVVNVFFMTLPYPNWFQIISPLAVAAGILLGSCRPSRREAVGGSGFK